MKPENEIQGIPKDWVYTPVDITLWKDNELNQIQITSDDNMVLKIPDSPNPMGKKIQEEDDETKTESLGSTSTNEKDVCPEIDDQDNIRPIEGTDKVEPKEDVAIDEGSVSAALALNDERVQGELNEKEQPTPCPAKQTLR